MPDTVFLTGATGYIGASLVEKWLTSSDANLMLLVRGKREESPEDRVRRLLAALPAGAGVEGYASRVAVVSGDVTFDRLGLAEADYRGLASRVTHVIHCAAAARFDLELADARRINVGGTQRILDFARACPALRRLDYIGTAYVAGRRRGVIREEELDAGQDHRNTYERTKFEAEHIVRACMKELAIAILRPSIVICDSRTGRASSHNGFYRALRMYWLGALKALPGVPGGRLDLVPVDYVTDAVYAISTQANTAGACYHLTAGEGRATTLDEIAQLAGLHFGKEPFAIVEPRAFAAQAAMMRDRVAPEQRDLIDEILLYMPYLTSDLVFDDANTRRVTGLQTPPVRSYFDRMAEFIKKNA